MPEPVKQLIEPAPLALLAGAAGFDPIKARLRMNVRATVEAVFEEELAGFPGRLRCARGEGAAKGDRHGHRERQRTGTFGTGTVRVPRARVEDATGKVTEWRSRALPRHRWLTNRAGTRNAPVGRFPCEGRGPDRRGPSRRHRHAACEAGAVRAVRGRRQQG
jgi:hypothetical protein